MAHFGDDVDALVTGTIASWDAERTADQLELLLGPDLQYIRINGAVVGGLAGLVAARRRPSDRLNQCGRAPTVSMLKGG